MLAPKRKREKDADFKKAKLKLGKGKKVPTNATNTSFKARSIALPDQNPLARAAAQQDPSAQFDPVEPLTSSGLNLDEVLIRLRHPNAGVKRDSLVGLKEILKVKREGEVGRVMRALGGIVSDEDASVRKGLLGLLDWYLGVTSESSLAPHLPLFLLHTSSALSHIFSDIRLDAARLVILLLNHVPTHITAGWPSSSDNVTPSGSSSTASGSTILEGLRLALGLGGEKASSAQGRLTAGGKLVFLRAVLGFVEQALSHSGTGGLSGDGRDMWSGWFEDGLGKDIRIRRSENVQIGRYGVALDGINEGSIINPGPLGLDVAPEPTWEIGRIQAGPSGSTGSANSSVTSLFLQLHPLLLSTFLESAPSAFSPSSSSASISASTETHIDLCSICASLTAVLADPIISAPNPDGDLVTVREKIGEFLKRMSTYFPFPSTMANTSTSGLGAGFDLNLSYARLAVLLAPQPVPLVYPSLGQTRQNESSWKIRVKAVEVAWTKMREETEKRKSKGKGKAVDSWAMDEIAAWVVDLLTPSQDISVPAITPATLKALLDIIWALLTQPPSTEAGTDSIPDQVGTALFSFFARQSASSQLRTIGDHFVISLIVVHEQRYPTLPFYLPVNSALRRQITTWVEQVPKALWELGSKDEQATGTLLGFLLDIGMKGEQGAEKPFSLLSVESYPGITARLAPFFHLSHPKRGSTMGPWTKLTDQRIKKLGLDMARGWAEWDVEGRLGEAVRIAQTAT